MSPDGSANQKQTSHQTADHVTLSERGSVGTDVPACAHSETKTCPLELAIVKMDAVFLVNLVKLLKRFGGEL